MKILGIESSCDDTSVALIEATKSGFIVLSEKTASQIDIHKKYGGVIPEIAGRKHAEKILPIIEEVLKEGMINASLSNDKTTEELAFITPDCIAVTAGPGLMTGLLVGTEVAKTLSYLWNIPVVRTNHIEGHIYSVLLNSPMPSLHPEFRTKGGDHMATAVKEESNNTKLQNTKKQSLVTSYQSPVTSLQFPALCLIVSGGHTELILMKEHGNYEKVGGTRDDAAGECFDKVAKLINLDYPGGPKISKYAELGSPTAIPFPRPMLHSDDLDMSFSGLKTAVLYWLKENAELKDSIFNLQSSILNDLCASFQQAIIDVLIKKTLKASKQYNPKTIILAGGVSANKKLRNDLKNEINHQFHDSLEGKSHSERISPVEFMIPNSHYSMDNAAMIAVAGYYHAIKKDFTPWQKLEANPQWKIYKK